MLKFALQRPIGVGVTLFSVIVFGVIAYLHIPLQLIPNGFNLPFMWVSIPTLAASPDENEQLIAKPIEDALATLPSIKKLRSFIRTSNVGFGLSLHPQSDPTLTYQRLRTRLRTHLPKLPEGSQFAFIWRHDPNDQPIYVVGIQFPKNTKDAAKIIEEHIKRPLERLNGVSRVNMNGIKAQEVRVQVRPKDLARFQINAQRLSQQLSSDNFTLSAGRIKTQGQQSWIRVSSRFEDLETLRDRPIAPNVLLKDIATVEIGPDPTPIIHRIDGDPAASLVIYKASTANTIDITQKITQTIERCLLRSHHLRKYKQITFFNQGEFILSSLNQIKQSALYGGIIAIFCLFWFLRTFSLTLLITSAIPICLCITITVLYLQGESLNILSMMGIILSIGMVIDNSIVVLEQVAQHRREGLSALKAAIQGSTGVALAITLATLTTLVVFLPLMMVNNQPMLAFFISQVGKPVCYGLIASLMIALIHLPTASQWISLKQGAQVGSSPRLTARYLSILRWVLHHRFLACVLTCLYLLSISYPFGKLNRIDKGKGNLSNLTIHVIGPLNGPYKRLNEISKGIENQILQRRDELDVRAVMTEPGWSPEHVRITLYLIPTKKQKLDHLVRQKKIEELLPQQAGYKIKLRRGGSNDNVEGVPISVYGPLLTPTTALAEQLANRIKGLPKIKDAQLDLPEGGLELRLGVHHRWASVHQLNSATIAGSINAQLQERSVGDFYGQDQKMRILFTPDQRGLTPDLIGRSINTPTSNVSTSKNSTSNLPSYAERPLDGFVHRALMPGLGKIKRQERKVHVSIQVLGEEAEVMHQLEKFLPHQTFPTGYGVDQGARFSDRERNEQGGIFAVLVGILLVFCIMGVLFESFIVPLAILFTIPLAFVGAAWMLWLTNTPFEVMAIIGGVILVGVVVNNGIVLIDQVQSLRRRGLSRDEALFISARTRLRPILMTALTTIGGLIPMGFGGGEQVGINYRPLGLMVIGGLLSSTLLTLVIVPLFYSLLDDLAGVPKKIRAISQQLIMSVLSLINRLKHSRLL